MAEKQKKTLKTGCLKASQKIQLIKLSRILPFTPLFESLPVAVFLLLLLLSPDVAQQRYSLIFPGHHFLVSALGHFVFLNFQQR